MDHQAEARISKHGFARRRGGPQRTSSACPALGAHAILTAFAGSRIFLFTVRGSCSTSTDRWRTQSGQPARLPRLIGFSQPTEVRSMLTRRPRPTVRSTFVTAALGLVLAAATAVHAQGSTPRFEPGPCPETPEPIPALETA